MLFVNCLLYCNEPELLYVYAKYYKVEKSFCIVYFQENRLVIDTELI